MRLQYHLPLTSMYGMSAGHQSTPGWRTDWLDIVVTEDDPVTGQGIQIWCRNLLRSMETHIIPTL